jgi:hydrocephalus-inducing protein
VGEPKEQPLFLKNQGQYPIKFDFSIKKKAQEIFTIEPMVGRLQPNEEINIVVRFLSQKEIKLKTNKSTADITLNILEGDQSVKHQSIPILVNVNAVFSKYQIAPLRNLNFGPMQYGETGTRTFEVRNEGLFEFKYAICDYNNEEEKHKIKEERKREADERLHGVKEEEDPKAKGGKKPDPKAAAPAKGAKPGKGEVVVDATAINVSQYTISPAIGSVAVGSTAVITVTFNAQGAKFYDNTLAIDVANRDFADRPDGIPFQLAAESSIPGINTEDLDQIFEEQTVIPSLDPKINTQTIVNSSLFSI